MCHAQSEGIYQTCMMYPLWRNGQLRTCVKQPMSQDCPSWSKWRDINGSTPKMLRVVFRYTAVIFQICQRSSSLQC